MTLARLHLLVGLATVIMFLLTGQYMDIRYDHLRGMDDTTRLLFRSTHVYLLFSGLLNLALGLYLPGREAAGGETAGGTAAGGGLLRSIGSVLILIGPLLFLAGFLREPFLGALARPFSTPALYATLAGMALHWLTSERR